LDHITNFKETIVELSEKDRLKEISVHLFYEIDMLNISAVKANNMVSKILHAKINDCDDSIIWKYQANLNCYLDSYAVHARSLTEFLKFKIKKEDITSVRAEHFLNEKKNNEFKKICDNESKLLNNIVRKANKQVTHLTYNRIQPEFQNENKGWEMRDIYRFNELFKNFLELVNEDLICKNLIDWKEKDNISRHYISRYIER